MNGWTDNIGRPFLRVGVRPSAHGPMRNLDCWIDTGFTGELLLPQPLVIAMGLSISGAMTAELGDGTEVELELFSCFVEWFALPTASAPLLGQGRRGPRRRLDRWKANTTFK